MIKILHYGLSKNPGGIETYLTKIWHNIDHEQFSFAFVDMHEGQACFRKELEAEGCLFFDIVHRKKSIFQNRSSWKKIFKEADIDILHCHFNTLSDITPVLLGIRYGKKVIVHSRSSKMSRSIVTTIMHRINFFRLPRNKVKMVAVSEKAGRWLFGKRTDFQIINNGVDTERFYYSEKNREFLREQYNLQNSFVVGHVGAFLPVKNHELILKIFKKVVGEKENARLILIGDGPRKTQIQILATEMGLDDKVIFLGKRNDVAEWYSAMDVFVFPSFFEGFPNVVLEAQATGLPCVISHVITDEVVKFPFCRKQSMDADAQEWCDMVLDGECVKDRERYRYEVEHLGYDVKNEIKKIEYLYKAI